MNVVFAFHNATAFRYYDGVVRELCAAGHTVKAVYGEKKKPYRLDRGLQECQARLKNLETELVLSKKNLWLVTTIRGLIDCINYLRKAAYGRRKKPANLDRGLRECQAQLKNLETELMLSKKNLWLVTTIRGLIDCINYLRPEHPTPWQWRRWRKTMIWPVKMALDIGMIRNLVATAPVKRVVRKIESSFPPDTSIVNWLIASRADIVIASPCIFPEFPHEIEYVKAARALNIPSVVAVMSWDNLTSKGTFHIIPDATFVWNNALLAEAKTLHEIPEDKIFITGAVPFDFWFEMKPSRDFFPLTTQIGISTQKPFILYLCSSFFIAGDETSFVREFAKVLFDCLGTTDVSLVVRPHPLNASVWKDFKDQNITIWPETPEWVDVESAKQDYYDTLYHSAAVVAVNTSAVLEAAILDKPCVTVMTERYKAKQTEVGHFKHLLDGDFLNVAHSFAETASILGDILAGRDNKKEQRHRFVKEFIRPWGIDKPASQIMARAIEAVALGKSIDEYSGSITDC